MTSKTPSFQPDQIQRIQDQVFDLVEGLLPETFYLVDVTFEKESGQWFLRVFIEGVSLDDCQAISQQLEEPLETIQALGSTPFNFEVSSPGLFRPLKTPREYQFYQGRAVKLNRPIPDENSKNPHKKPKIESIAAVLQDFDSCQNQIVLTIDIDHVIEIPLETLQDNTSHVSICLNPEIAAPV